MNRRSFLSSFLKGAITTIAAPQIVTHGLRLVTKRLDSGLYTGEWELNPDYVDAEYEVYFVSIPYVCDFTNDAPIRFTPDLYKKLMQKVPHPPNMGNIFHKTIN